MFEIAGSVWCFWSILSYHALLPRTIETALQLNFLVATLLQQEQDNEEEEAKPNP